MLDSAHLPTSVSAYLRGLAPRDLHVLRTALFNATRNEESPLFSLLLAVRGEIEQVHAEHRNAVEQALHEGRHLTHVPDELAQLEDLLRGDER